MARTQLLNPKVSLVFLINKLEDMFPTLTGFENDLKNPYINRSVLFICFNNILLQIVNGTAFNTGPYMQGRLPSTQTVLPTCSKLLVSNLPLNFDEDAVYKFLKSFGKIKTLEMIRDPITGNYSVSLKH